MFDTTEGSFGSLSTRELQKMLKSDIPFVLVLCATTCLSSLNGIVIITVSFFSTLF